MNQVAPVESTATPEPAKPAKPVKRPRHLMDPDNLQRPVNDFHLTNVQRWVWAVTIVAVAWHMAAGCAAASLVLKEDATAARIGLNVIAAIFGVLGMVAGFAMHKKNAFAWRYVPWLAFGLLPGIVGAFFALR
ncbi:hypothetical protein [Nocardioides sp.]|uniref:hypothetical protein n=1 Tax=Nocardioides sp. TaxID=35761 RepID=UPI00260259FE|nr:hypothetical protein [Nocardioides sp.]